MSASRYRLRKRPGNSDPGMMIEIAYHHNVSVRLLFMHCPHHNQKYSLDVQSHKKRKIKGNESERKENVSVKNKMYPIEGKMYLKDVSAKR